ncbi:hypothetical protein LINPERPRIM_LOCUS25231 [Linum perenne]
MFRRLWSLMKELVGLQPRLVRL